ncbi:hypothetical protein ACVWXQ_007944 [Bradyrhizobium sp. S3.14.4]
MAAIVSESCARAGSKVTPPAKLRISSISARAFAAKAWAWAVATMPRPDLANSGSPAIRRNLFSP